MKPEEPAVTATGANPNVGSNVNTVHVDGGNGTVVSRPPAAPARESIGAVVLMWVKTVLIALVIVVVINSVLFASVVVPTSSMENEVMAGDFLFVNKFIYGGTTPQVIPFANIPLPFVRFPGLREPERNDVIVFIYPGARDMVEAPEFQYYLKRCVATAGDTLQIRNGVVYINSVRQANPPNALLGRVRNDPHDRLNTFPPGAEYTRDNWGPMRIPKKGDVVQLDVSNYNQWRIFIEREGHDVSKRGEIISIDGGQATTYTVERDYVFGLGDNRSNSEDSRYWGFIPVENVIGTPMIVYWSWDPDIHLSDIGEKIGSIRWDRIFEVIE